MVMIYQISNDDYRIRIHKIVAATSEATNARNEIFYFTENKKKNRRVFVHRYNFIGHCE